MRRSRPRTVRSSAACAPTTTRSRVFSAEEVRTARGRLRRWCARPRSSAPSGRGRITWTCVRFPQHLCRRQAHQRRSDRANCRCVASDAARAATSTRSGRSKTRSLRSRLHQSRLRPHRFRLRLHRFRLRLRLRFHLHRSRLHLHRSRARFRSLATTARTRPTQPAHLSTPASRQRPRPSRCKR